MCFCSDGENKAVGPGSQGGGGRTTVNLWGLFGAYFIKEGEVQMFKLISQAL